jgi:hypothetical protein
MTFRVSCTENFVHSLKSSLIIEAHADKGGTLSDQYQKGNLETNLIDSIANSLFRIRENESFLFYIQPTKAAAFSNNIPKVHSKYVKFNKIRTHFVRMEKQICRKVPLIETLIYLQRSTGFYFR